MNPRALFALARKFLTDVETELLGSTSMTPATETSTLPASADTPATETLPATGTPVTGTVVVPPLANAYATGRKVAGGHTTGINTSALARWLGVAVTSNWCLSTGWQMSGAQYRGALPGEVDKAGNLLPGIDAKTLLPTMFFPWPAQSGDTEVMLSYDDDGTAAVVWFWCGNSDFPFKVTDQGRSAGRVWFKGVWTVPDNTAPAGDYSLVMQVHDMPNGKPPMNIVVGEILPGSAAGQPGVYKRTGLWAPELEVDLALFDWVRDLDQAGGNDAHGSSPHLQQTPENYGELGACVPSTDGVMGTMELPGLSLYLGGDDGAFYSQFGWQGDDYWHTVDRFWRTRLLAQQAGTAIKGTTFWRALDGCSNDLTLVIADGSTASVTHDPLGLVVAVTRAPGQNYGSHLLAQLKAAADQDRQIALYLSAGDRSKLTTDTMIPPGTYGVTNGRDPLNVGGPVSIFQSAARAVKAGCHLHYEMPLICSDEMLHLIGKRLVAETPKGMKTRMGLMNELWNWNSAAPYRLDAWGRAVQPHGRPKEDVAFLLMAQIAGRYAAILKPYFKDAGRDGDLQIVANFDPNMAGPAGSWDYFDSISGGDFTKNLDGVVCAGYVSWEGSQGNTGPANTGWFDAAKAYKKGDLQLSQNRIWIALADVPAGQAAPEANATAWGWAGDHLDDFIALWTAAIPAKMAPIKIMCDRMRAKGKVAGTYESALYLDGCPDVPFVRLITTDPRVEAPARETLRQFYAATSDDVGAPYMEFAYAGIPVKDSWHMQRVPGEDPATAPRKRAMIAAHEGSL